MIYLWQTSETRIKELYRYARIEKDLFELLKDKYSRDILRAVLKETYTCK